MKRKVRALFVGAAALLATVVATGTASASDWHWYGLEYSDGGVGIALADGSELASDAVSYGANGAVKVCDERGDGYGASVVYERVNSTGPATVWAEGGAVDCESSSNIESNPVYRFKLCRDVPGDDICSEWWYTGRS